MKETNITPQQLWRTAVGTTKHDPNSTNEGPSPIWRAQFKAQATQDMMDEVMIAETPEAPEPSEVES